MTNAEVHAGLRELIRLEDEGSALDDWYSSARAFQEKTLGVVDLPEGIVHYLIDADIRRKDARYREVQRDVVRRFLDELATASE
jgi:hypothetical protein